MRVGVVLEDNKGLESNVSMHFGQCRFFLIADLDGGKKKIVSSRVVPNPASHGGGGCVAVDEILKHKITHVISGGMGMGAQEKFAQAGVEVFGCSGNVEKAINDLMDNALSGLDSCKEHGHEGTCR